MMISKSMRLNQVSPAACNRLEKARRTANTGKGKKALSLSIRCTIRVGNKTTCDNLNIIGKPGSKTCFIFTIYDGKRKLWLGIMG